MNSMLGWKPKSACSQRMITGSRWPETNIWLSMPDSR